VLVSNVIAVKDPALATERSTGSHWACTSSRRPGGSARRGS